MSDLKNLFKYPILLLEKFDLSDFICETEEYNQKLSDLATNIDICGLTACRNLAKKMPGYESDNLQQLPGNRYNLSVKCSSPLWNLNSCS